MNMEVSNNINGTNEQETVVILDAGAQYGKVRSMATSPVICIYESLETFRPSSCLCIYFHMNY